MRSTASELPPVSVDERLWTLTYYSSARELDLHPDVLTRIMEQSRSRNTQMGITGILLYFKGSFFQVLEGPKEAVELVFKRFIVPARSHFGVQLALSGPCEGRLFPEWSMEYKTFNRAEEAIRALEELNRNVSKNCSVGMDTLMLTKSFVRTTRHLSSTRENVRDKNRISEGGGA